MYNDSLKYIIAYDARDLKLANSNDPIGAVVEERFLINAIKGHSFEETLSSVELLYCDRVHHNTLFEIGVRATAKITDNLPESLLLKGMSGHFHVDVAALDSRSLMVILFPKRDSIAYLKRTGELNNE